MYLLTILLVLIVTLVCGTLFVILGSFLIGPLLVCGAILLVLFLIFESFFNFSRRQTQPSDCDVIAQALMEVVTPLSWIRSHRSKARQSQ